MAHHHMNHVKRPELWTMLLLINEQNIHVVRFSTAQSQSLILDVIELSGDSDFKTRLETAIYDNEPLLDDYAHTRVIIRATHFLLLPPNACDDATAEQLITGSLAEPVGDPVLADAYLDNEPRVAMMLPSGVFGFLKRTFNNCLIHSHISPLINAANAAAGSVNSGLWLFLDQNRMDAAVMRGGSLICANSFAFSYIDDAAYFALKLFETAHLSQQHDDIQLFGSHPLMPQLLEKLRRYVASVMPQLPAAQALKLGSDAPAVPFPLLHTALCITKLRN